MNAAKAIGKKLMEKKWPIAGNAFWSYVSYNTPCWGMKPDTCINK
ncbi:MAG TPA: hypothetical protein PKA28_11435 [Methylomusa anaerophila]|nr:hypothetical protein [Methylomusa anaerophila]HML89046.1 hypothetical protein [Methylomusa anaerophila]